MIKFKKSELRKIKFKKPRYSSTKYKNSIYKYLMLCELDVVDNIQIIRFFELYNECNYKECIEVQRFFIRDDGENFVMSYGSFFSYYSYRFNFNTKFDFRKYLSIHCYPHKIIIKNVLPCLKKFFVDVNYLYDDIYIPGYVANLLIMNSSNNLNSLESLFSINKEMFCEILHATHFIDSGFKYICKFLRSFQLVNKWNYKISDMKSYLDHLDLLEKLNLDLRNPKYIAPVKLLEQHYELSKRYSKIIKKTLFKEKLKDFKDYEEKITNYDLINFQCIKDEFKIIPLLSLSDFEEEGKINKNCVYSNSYYNRPDSLIFTSFINDEKLETIEYSLINKKVVQCHGLKNNDTQYHDLIIDLANKSITNYLFART